MSTTIYKSNVSIISGGNITPCIARVFKDGRWQRCSIKYNVLLPLDGIKMVSSDGYIMMDANNLELVTRE